MTERMLVAALRAVPVGADGEPAVGQEGGTEVTGSGRHYRPDQTQLRRRFYGGIDV